MTLRQAQGHGEQSQTMKILVAGGAGFIGSHLCGRLLSEHHEIICVDNLLTGNKKNIETYLNSKLFTFVNHDVTEPLPDSITADAVFHLASPASPNHYSSISYHSLPLETMNVNTAGTMELLKFTEKNHAKFLFASTSEIYGDPQVHPQTEDYRGNTSTTGPRSVYDEAKRYGETITAYFGRSKNVDARIARIYKTYGQNMMVSYKRMIISFITQALKNEPITVFGDGSQTRSLCYVDDMIEGLHRLMFYPDTKGTIVNLGAPEEHTVKEYAVMVKELLNSKSEIKCTESLPTDDPKKRCADITLAKKLLQWEPKVTLEEGLKKTIQYFKVISS